jgi:hypothetical protein
MPPKAPSQALKAPGHKALSEPSWILPGRVINPAMKHKAILETSFAFSRTFNSRNIEFHWYALWAQTLSDLVADVPNLIVAPQFPVWFVPMQDDHEDEDDGDDPEEIVQPPEEQNAPGKQADDEEFGCGVGDVSFASTVPEKNANQVVVDFAILHLMAVAQPQQMVRYGGWRIAEANIGLLVEVKRFASRSLKGEEQKQEISGEISEACNDLVIQAAHVFIQDSKKQYVFAIAASGNCPNHLSAVYVMTVILQVHTGAVLQFTVPKSLEPCIFLLTRTRVINPPRKNQPIAS